MANTENLAFAQAATLRPIHDVAADLGIDPQHLEPYGRAKAKVSLEALARPAQGRVVLVSAINPTPAGEGKTTTSVGLAQGLAKIGARACVALREPSLGPVFGVKGGGCGGGRSQVAPMVDINLHFTGDLHAISSAHNLLAAGIDNALHHGTAGELDPRSVTWRRCMDMNDRALRKLVIGLGGKSGGVPRETGFDITAASEVMAILALADGLDDLKARLGRIVVGAGKKGPITCRDLGYDGAMTVLLADAIKPNLVQTLEGVPAIVHCGPFGNIAHGCSSVLGTRLARAYADIVVTEGGFGFDLGAEKFLDIKCRTAGIWPSAVVLVATLRALKMHGGVGLKEIDAAAPEALRAGFANLAAHIGNARRFGLEPIVAINRRRDDRDDETAIVVEMCAALGVKAVPSDPFGGGGEGCTALAEVVRAAVAGAPEPTPKFLYDTAEAPKAKIETIARQIYGADGVDFVESAEADLRRIERWGLAGLPICMAKTQYSLSDDPELPGAPKGFRVRVREVRLSAGAGFMVALTGDVLTMPGLPKEPAALAIGLGDDGLPSGLF